MKIKKILILGMARSGYEVAKLLQGKYEIIVTDAKEQDKNKVEELENLGIKFVLSKEPETIIDDTFDLLIKNPAVFPFHPCVEKARSLNIPIVNEMEVAYHFLPKNVRIIGVTGSNGKTTTTSLIYESLKKSGVPVKLGGNIGTPLSEIVPTIKEGDTLLLEISDHQLIDFHDFKTNYSVLTNLCPTHLDYHGSYEAYKSIKKKIFNHHTKSDIAILNAHNEDSLELTKDISSTKYYFNNDINYIKDDYIYLDSKPLININDIILKGTHNYENILATLVLFKTLNLDTNYVVETLKSFRGVEHRLEFVRTLDGVKYYNDSKSTNPTSTVTALKSFDANIHLILGGMDRNQEFDDLVPYLNRVSKIYAIGEVRDKIEAFSSKNNVKCVKYEFMKDALTEITKNVSSGDIVLLSPGSASWDQYLKFEDRGDEFKNFVNNL